LLASHANKKKKEMEGENHQERQPNLSNKIRRRNTTGSNFRADRSKSMRGRGKEKLGNREKKGKARTRSDIFMQG